MEATSDERCAVQRVLDRDMAYDDLATEEEQAVVRAVWDERIAARIAALNLEREFIEQGRSWTDADAEGNPTRRMPDDERGV